MTRRLFYSICLTVLLCTAAFSGPRVAVHAASGSGAPAAHGIERLRAVLRDKGFEATTDAGDFVILAGVSADDSAATRTLRLLHVELPRGAEALAVRRTTLEGKPAIVLCGADSRGLMYAALDTAERISWSTEAKDPFAFVKDTSEQPYVRERSVSMYTMQRAYFESRLHDAEQWKRYFDLLAASRINSFVVIFGYENGGFMAPPYPFFFDVDGFPDVEMVGLTHEQQARNAEDFRTMIRLAHERGIEVTAGIWDHIYRGGVQGGGIPGASENAGKRVAGLVWGVTTENLAPYTKAAVEKFLRVFPELDGLQFRMHGESGLKRDEMEGFWHEVFAMIKATRPEMRVDLRAKDLPDSIIADAIGQGLHSRVTTKVWMEQMGLPFHPTHVNRQNQHDRRHGYADLLRYPQTYRVHWRVWNGGTTRLLLWGDPEYVRRFAASAHLYDGDSLEVNEMLATKMLGEPQDRAPLAILNPKYRYYTYEFERYWHFYQVWGRVSYNPNTPAEVWEQEFQRRFGAAGLDLMAGLHLASNVLPRIVAASYRYQLFPTTRGWAEMMREDDLPKYADAEGSDIEQFMSLRDAARSILDGRDTSLRRPEETSRWFADTSRKILARVQAAEAAAKGRESNEMISTITDLKILARLAEYHSERLRGGVDYNLYKESGDLLAFDDAMAHERNAAAAWEKLVEAAGDVYNHELAFGVHQVGFSRHWAEELQNLRKGLDRLAAERKAARLRTEGSGPRIAHVPVRRAEPGKPVELRATVAAAGGLREVRAVVTGADGTEARIAMHETGPGLYKGQLNASGPIRYFLEAIDTAGGRSTFPAKGRETAIAMRRSADEQPPKVRLDATGKAEAGTDLRITARAQDGSGIKSLRLRYRHLTQYEDYQTAEMTLDPATGAYTGRIPGEFITPQWDLMYFVEALDGAGNGRNYPDLDVEAPYVVVTVERARH